MSEDNNINNETPKSKSNISPNDRDNITTNTNNDNKNSSIIDSPTRNNDNKKNTSIIDSPIRSNDNKKNTSIIDSTKRNTKKDLLTSLLSLDKKLSSKNLIDETKLYSNLLDNETIVTETTNKESRKIARKSTYRRKRKKGKKEVKIEQKQPETESILLTEVKKIPKKKEESENHKFLRKKLENLNFSKNLQMAINSGFEKVNDEVKDDLIDNYNINENKKNTIDELVSKPRKNLKLNLNIDLKDIKGIKYKIDKESINRLKNLKIEEKHLKIKLKKIEENQKLLDSELPIKNDIISNINRKNNIKKIALMKNDLLSQLNYNSSKISQILDSNRLINRNVLIKNYMSPEIHKKSRNDNINNNKAILDTVNKNFCLSEDQERFNKHLLQIQKEEKLHREKIQKDLKISSEKKSREIELKENTKLQRQKCYLEELKTKEKKFLNKIKEKNNLILEKSNKYIGEKSHKKQKDYLFYQFKKKFENNEKKLIDKVNLMKKDPLVTKKELEELANKREEQKKILEEGLNERKLKLIKMWKERSQTLPVYKHPIVDMLEDEEFDLLDEKEEKKEKKEKNELEKRNYRPPKVKIDLNLKNIRENRNIKTNKDSVTQTEINNKNRLLKNLDFMANIIQAAKEENIELKKKNKKNKLNDLKYNERIINSVKKINNLKSLDINENRIRHNFKLLPKPDKPIDYLKEIIKQKKNTNKKMKIDKGVGNIFSEIKPGGNDIIETLDMVKSINNAIDRKVIEKKEALKIKGGYLNNTKLGDEVGNLLIESIQNKLSLLNKLNG